jgi:norsolorinic acid ketoreductase
MVATEMGKVGFEALKQQGIDLTAHIISVEQSTQGMKKVVSGLLNTFMSCTVS